MSIPHCANGYREVMNCHLLSWCSLDVPIFLAFVTLLNEVLHFFLHCWPEIACFSDLRYQGPWPRVISANAFVNFFKDISLFVLFGTP